MCFFYIVGITGGEEPTSASGTTGKMMTGGHLKFAVKVSLFTNYY